MITQSHEPAPAEGAVDALERMTKQAPTVFMTLVDALAWWRSMVSDGPAPGWVVEAEQVIADVLVGDRADAQSRSEAIDEAVGDAIENGGGS